MTLVASKQQHDVQLVGPLTDDSSWQAQAGKGYAAACFAIDWEAQRVTCPAGQHSSGWKPAKTGYGAPAIHVHFATKTCRACAVRELCTKSASSGRGLTLKPKEQHIAMLTQREQQQNAGFRAKYKPRAGVEGTVSQGLRVGGLRQSRYIGLAKTALQHILIAVALNLLRLCAWYDEQPVAKTRRSAFAALASSLGLTPTRAAFGF
jgi:transposase